MLVVIEVVDRLMRAQTHVINVKYLCGPLEIKIRRPHVFVLVPTFFCQGFSQFCVATFDNENLLIGADSILPLPGGKVHELRLLFSVSLLFRLFAVILDFLLFLLFASALKVLFVTSFVLETSKLLIGQVVEFDSAFVAAFGFEVFFHELLNF